MSATLSGEVLGDGWAMAMALAVLIVPMLLALAIVSWRGRRKPKDNGLPIPTCSEHGTHP